MKKTIIAACILAAVSVTNAQGQTDTARKHIDVPEVEVNASRTNAKLKDLPQKVEVISLKKLNNSAASNVGEALKLNSSVDIIQYPGILSSVGMRGFAPTTNNKYNALLINGVPAGTRNIASLGLANISQIEIMKGPFSSMYGSNAMAGVINIVTPRHKDSLQGSATISAGSFMTTHTDVAAGGRIAGPISFDASFTSDQQGSDYVIGKNNLLTMSETDKAIIDAGKTSGERMKNTTYSQMTGNLRLGADIGKNWEVHLCQGLYSAKDVMSHGSFWGVYSNGKKDLSRFTERIELEGRIKNHTICFTPYMSRDISDNYNNGSDTAYLYYRAQFSTYGGVLYDRIAIGKHSLVAGISSGTEQNASKLWSDASTRMSPYVPDYKNESMAAFLQANMHFFEDKLHLAAGGRYDMIDFSILATDNLPTVNPATEKYTTFNPNIGLKYEITRWANLHSSWGTAFFAPDATNVAGDYTYNGTTYKGNPDLKPETSQTVDAGIGISKRDIGIDLDVTAFATKHSDLITSDKVDPDGTKKSGDEYTTYINAQKADLQGIELQAAYDLGAIFDYRFSLKFYANATIMTKASMKINDTTTREQKYVRKQNANFGIEYACHKGIRIRLNGRYIGSRIEDNWFSYYPVRTELAGLATQSQPEYAKLGQLKHPAFMVFDCSAMYDINSRFSLGATLANILDENYTEKDGYNMPGRNVMGKCVVKF